MFIQLLTISLAFIRIPHGKRYTFFRHSFPIILNKTFSVIRKPDQNDMYDQERLDQLVKEKELSEILFSNYISTLVEYAAEFSLVFEAEDMKKVKSDANLRREHAWVLFWCFQLLVKIYSSSQLIANHATETVQIMVCI
jgi:hypothetical protein